MTYQETIEALERVPLYGHKDGTRNIDRLMARFGHPEQKLRVIHAAGTNGKGSCCAMLASILQAAGYRVGLYTSPHLVDYGERIQVNGRPIPEADFCRLYEKVMAENRVLVDEGFHHITYFEILTAMAFLYYTEAEADYVVLETGVGGRLDATNIIHQPLLCLITSISRDHMTVLGDTIPEIAGEKAGIIKENVPVVVSRNVPEVYDVIQKKAVSLSAPLCYAVDQPVRCLKASVDGQLLEAEGVGTFRLPLPGGYQRENVQCVLRAVSELKVPGLTPEVIRRGLETVRWPGRMQHLKYRGRDIIIDGAHNEDAARRLNLYMKEQDLRITLVLAVLKKKDMVSVLKAMLADAPPVDLICSAPAAGAPSVDKDEIDQVLEAEGIHVRHVRYPSASAALEAAAGDGSGRLILVAGSLYLAGEILAFV